MSERKNISSGAEKAEKLALANKGGKSAATKANKATNEKTVKEEKSEKKSNTTAAKKSVKGGKSKPIAHKKEQKKGARKHVVKDKKRGEKRAERAKIAAERKQKRLDSKLAHKEHREERRAALKQKREERKARREEMKSARKERRQVLKSESKEARSKRIAEERKLKREARAAKREAYLKDKKARREHALKVRAEKRAERAENKRAPGFGGWLAAVISLGVTTLALGTVVTFGWLNMNEMQVDMQEAHTQSLYELNAIVDDLDVDLARAQVSSSASDRVRVFADIASESRTAETVIERLPVEAHATEKLSAFVNKMGDSARDMLFTVANGGELSPSQVKTLKYMYDNNRQLKAQLNELTAECGADDVICAMRGKQGKLYEGFYRIENYVFEVPDGIDGGAFGGVKKVSAEYIKDMEEITAQAAEKLAMQYFKDYGVTGAACTGEAAAENITVYNVNLATDDGEMLVQLSKKGGKVVAFDSYKECTEKKFACDKCVSIAEDFLKSLGYGELKAVFISEYGTSCDITCTPVEDGAVIYTDKVLVKVCEERGKVVGLEAIDYVMHHAERELPGVQLGKEQAKESINGNIEVTSVRKAVIPVNDGERLCYEFAGTLEGTDYYVYVDAVTGEELEVLTVVGTATGRILR